MIVTLPDDLMIGLSREANRRGVSIETLVAKVLRCAIDDKLFHAIIDDDEETRAVAERPEQIHVNGESREYMPRSERRLHVLRAVDQMGVISLRDIDPKNPARWHSAIMSLVEDGKLVIEERRSERGQKRHYYRRAT